MSKLITTKNWGRSKGSASTKIRIIKSKKTKVVSPAKAKAKAIKSR